MSGFENTYGVEPVKPYEKDRQALITSKYFDYRGSGMDHATAMKKAREYVDSVMPQVITCHTKMMFGE